MAFRFEELLTPVPWGYYLRIKDPGQIDINLIYLTTWSSQNLPDTGFQKQMVALRLAGPVSAHPWQHLHSPKGVWNTITTQKSSMCVDNERLGPHSDLSLSPSVSAPPALILALHSEGREHAPGPTLALTTHYTPLENFLHMYLIFY